MSGRTRCLALIFLAVLGYFGWHHSAWLLSLPSMPQDWRIGKVQEATASVGYVVDDQHELAFDLPAETSLVRLVTNADLPTDARADLGASVPVEQSWKYVLAWEARDAAGRLLSSRHYHFQSGVTEYRDAAAQINITGTFYLVNELIPLNSRSAVINLTALAGKAARLRVRLVHLDAPLSGVVVRAYVLDERSDYHVRHQWLRLSKERKNLLARGNVYEPELLTGAEKASLLQKHWAALAPSGIRGRDYFQRDVYTLLDIEGAPLRDSFPAAGLLVERQCRAVISVPEGGGTVALRFQAHQPGAWSAPEPRLEASWYGLGIGQRVRDAIPWHGSKTVFERSLAGGFLEISGEQPVIVRAFLKGGPPELMAGQDEVEITPEPAYVWSYRAAPGEPVEFACHHAGDAATPLRIDLRRQFVSGPLGPASIRFEMLDERGRLVGAGRLAVDGGPSLYDSVYSARAEVRLTDPSRHFFAIPQEVRRLRLVAEQEPVLITAHNRPGALVRLTRVPEDYYAFERDQTVQRTWFLLRAIDHDNLMRSQRVIILLLQNRPPEDDPEVAAGRFQWNDFHPEGAWSGRFLLAARKPGVPFRAEALATTFREVPLNRAVDIKVQAPLGRSAVSATLVFLKEDAGPAALRIAVDGRALAEETVSGTRGELTLPALPVSEVPRACRLRVDATGKVRVFVNHVDPAEQPALVKRLASSFDSRLSFFYDKVRPDDELLSLTLFKPPGSKARTRLRVSIEAAPAPAAGPFSSWSFRERRFDLSQAQGDVSAVLGAEEWLDAGRVFYFLLGQDCPPGRYRITVEREAGPRGYLAVSRALAGLHMQRDLFLEMPRRPESE